MMALQLDHLVINTKFDLDRYQLFFSSLGFILTPRSRHSLGSMNHLILFNDCYLELVGMEAGGKIRKDIHESHQGIDGLVFKMNDAGEVFKRLEKAGITAQPPERFNRMIEGGKHAEFVTVRLEAGQFPEGRIYFCQHLTPELIWIPKYMKHPNGVNGLSHLTLAAPDVLLAQQGYGKMGVLEDFCLDIQGEEEIQENYGLQKAPGRYFIAMTFHCDDLDRVAAYAIAAKADYRFNNNKLLVLTIDGNILEFEA